MAEMSIQCQFINNTASISGGAIFKTEENEELIIDQNIYENNMANAIGGAIYASGMNSLVTVTDSVFINNTAHSFGGAVYVLGTNSSIDSHLINNIAMIEGGGAIYSNGQ